jgi:hypothetical protein
MNVITHEQLQLRLLREPYAMHEGVLSSQIWQLNL